MGLGPGFLGLCSLHPIALGKKREPGTTNRQKHGTAAARCHNGGGTAGYVLNRPTH